MECHGHCPDHLHYSPRFAVSLLSCWPPFHGTSISKSYWFFQGLLALGYFSYPCDPFHTENTWHMKKLVFEEMDLHIHEIRIWVMINVKHLGDKKLSEFCLRYLWIRKYETLTFNLPFKVFRPTSFRGKKDVLITSAHRDSQAFTELLPAYRCSKISTGS